MWSPAANEATPFSPDEPAVLKSLLYANLIFMGPGSPTYAVRQLQGSLAWDIVRARASSGCNPGVASAATVSIGAWAIPVYEIYKVGEDVHSKAGLNFFSDFGMHLSFVPHWNNTDGGEDVDTSRCFIGMDPLITLVQQPASETRSGNLMSHTGWIIGFLKRDNVK